MRCGCDRTRMSSASTTTSNRGASRQAKRFRMRWPDGQPNSDRVAGAWESLFSWVRGPVLFCAVLFCAGRSASGRIKTTAAKGMAAANATESPPASAHRSVFLHRFDEVLTATWREATLGAKQRADRQLVKSHQGNQQASRQLPENSPPVAHLCSPRRGREERSSGGRAKRGPRCRSRSIR